MYPKSIWFKHNFMAVGIHKYLSLEKMFPWTQNLPSVRSDFTPLRLWQVDLHSNTILVFKGQQWRTCHLFLSAAWLSAQAAALIHPQTTGHGRQFPFKEAVSISLRVLTFCIPGLRWHQAPAVPFTCFKTKKIYISKPCSVSMTMIKYWFFA